MTLKMNGIVEQSLIKVDPKSEDAVIVTTITCLIDEKSLAQYDKRLSDIYNNDSWDAVTFKQRTGTFTANIKTEDGKAVVSIKDCKIKEIKFKLGKENVTTTNIKLTYWMCQEQDIIKTLVSATGYKFELEKQAESEIEEPNDEPETTEERE